MIRRRLFTSGPTDPPGFDREECLRQPTDRYISYDGARFHCRALSSTDGSWTVVFGRRRDGDHSRCFRFRHDDLVDTRRVSRPVDGAIAGDGTTILVLGDDPAAIGGEILVFDDDTILSRRFETTLGRPVIRPDGGVCAVSTRPPKPTVQLFCLRSQTRLLERSFRDRTVRLLGYHSEGDDTYLYVGIRSTGDPYLALDENAEVAWESDRHWATRSLSDRVGSVVASIRSNS